MARTYMNPGAAKEVHTRVYASKAIEDEIFNPENPLSRNPFQVEHDGYDDMTVVELKAALKHRNLSTNGKKAELIQRLRLDDADPVTSEEVPADAATDEEEVAPADAAVTDTPLEEAAVSESEENSGQEPDNESTE